MFYLCELNSFVNFFLENSPNLPCHIFEIFFLKKKKKKGEKTHSTMGVKRKLVTQKDCHFCQHMKVLRTSPLTTMKWCVLAILDEVVKLHPKSVKLSFSM